MTLGEGFYAWAKTVSAITDVLGSEDACRIYPVAALNAKTAPFAVYEAEKDKEFAIQDDAPSVGQSLFKLSCIAIDTSAAEALADIFRVALTRPPLFGDLGGLTIQRVFYEGSTPSYEWEEQQFAVDIQFKFQYRES